MIEVLVPFIKKESRERLHYGNRSIISTSTLAAIYKTEVLLKSGFRPGEATHSMQPPNLQ